MVHPARTALHVAVSLAALLFILFPEARAVSRFLLVPLYVVMGADMLIQGWRGGHLRKTFGELARDPPRTGAWESLAFFLSFIALAMIFML
jgi:hypothetical protein